MLMKRYQDIIELLETVESNITSLKKSYDKAKKDEEQKEVLRPIVKSSLEHLRSILEYSTQDIWFSYNSRRNKDLYFPYGKTEALFKKSVERRRLSTLANTKPKLYSLIESLQPHKCNNDWLIELCKQTNFNKHDRLSSQVRENSKESTINIGRAVRIDGNGDGGVCTFVDCNFNGIPVGHGKPAVISGDMSAKQVQEIIGAPIPITKEFEWVEFRFEDSTIDTLMLIEKAYTEISKYISSLKSELS
jgi:hypothetical protein